MRAMKRVGNEVVSLIWLTVKATSSKAVLVVAANAGLVETWVPKSLVAAWTAWKAGHGTEVLEPAVGDVVSMVVPSWWLAKHPRRDALWCSVE